MSENGVGTSPFQAVGNAWKVLMTSANILRQKPIGGLLGVIENERVRYLNDRHCAADFSLLNLPKGKSLGRSKPATNS